MITKDELAEWICANESVMYRLALGILTNRADAEDAVCEAVVRAFEHMGDLRDKTKLKSWMMCILSNVAKTMYQKRKHDLCNMELTDSYIDEKPQDLFLWNTVMKLPDSHREIVILFYYYGYKIREIAQILGIRTGTVQSRLQRAREKLREEYGEKEKENDHKNDNGNRI